MRLANNEVASPKKPRVAKILLDAFYVQTFISKSSSTETAVPYTDSIVNLA